MANVLDLRRRIKSVKNTRQITKAMKMVSAAKLRRAQERAMSGRPYALMLSSLLQSLKRRIEVYDPISGEIRSPLLLTREEKKVLLVVVTGDKGFAGGFNANIFKAATHFMAAKKSLEIDIEAIGRKGRDLYRRRYPVASYSENVDQETVANQIEAKELAANGEHPQNDHANDEGSDDKLKRAPRSHEIEVTGDHPGILDRLDFARVNELGKKISRLYIREEIDAAYIVYNEFKSVIAQRVVVERVLPIVELGRHDITASEEQNKAERERAAEAAAGAGVSLEEPDTSEADEEAKKFGTSEVDYIYEQPPQELFNALLPRYVTTQLYHAMLESVAAEHAARMTAMDSATNNASDILDALTLKMNRVRQAAITKEIIEIVSGAAALS